MLENVLTQGKAKLFYLRRADIRTAIDLIGTKNQINHVFTTPEKFVHLSGNSIKIKIYRNGQRQFLHGDYEVSESGGSGTGFDTITFYKPPRFFESLVCDYIVDISHSVIGCS